VSGWNEDWYAEYRARSEARRVPASHGLSAGRGGGQGSDPADSENAPPAPSGVNAARGRSGKRISRDGGEPRRNKFNAIRTEGAGPNGERRTYDSRKEARAARELNAEMSAGLIASWVPQVSLPMGKDEAGRDVRYRADALAVLQVNPDGTFVGRFVDVKGRDTSTSRAKRAALRALYQIDVKVI
jgi:hypothetical protein